MQSLATVKPGTKLNPKQQHTLGRWLTSCIQAIAIRRKQTLLVHSSLQQIIGTYFHSRGRRVDFEVPFRTGGFSSEGVIFDVVAEKRGSLWIIEVKDAITSRDLGQVYGYMSCLQRVKRSKQVFLGTDVLNYGSLVTGSTGTIVRDLMEQKGLGVILADKYLIGLFLNYTQLTLAEMPLFEEILS